MKFPRSLLLAFLASLSIAGCGTFTEAELATMQHRGVPPHLVARMQDGEPLTPEDVIELTRRGVPPLLIVRQIEDAGVNYLLTRTDFERLRQAGVDRAVIAELAAASDDFAASFAAPQYDPYLADPYYDDYFYGPQYSRRIGVGISTRRYFPHRHRH